MKYVPLRFPPGLVRPGTAYDAKGRWYDANLVRWRDGALQPVGGWASLVSSGLVPVRGMFAWKRNDGTGWIALGMRNALKVYSSAGLADITPTGLNVGVDLASGTYLDRVEAHSWQFDAFGEDLVAVPYTDGRLFYWNSSGGTTSPAAPLTNAPINNKGVVVTPERIIVALGGGSPADARYIKWCDQEDSTDWTPTSTNQAGDFYLPSQGALMAGRRSRSETLIWTDVDLWAMRYIGGDLIYSFQQVGEKCGAASRRSMAVVDTRAFWMGNHAFYAYDGFVKQIPCEVGDYVFNRINREQASKIVAVPNTDFGEITWYYPSTAGTENDSFVTLNYVEGWWTLGSLERTDGIDRGFLEYPLLADASGGIYEHENGTLYGGAVPYIESGPLEIGEGDQTLSALQYVPDEEDLGEVQTRLYTRFYPTAPETTHGPFTNANPTDVRITGRQVRIRHTQVTAGWRVGTPRLGVVPGGRR